VAESKPAVSEAATAAAPADRYGRLAAAACSSGLPDVLVPEGMLPNVRGARVGLRHTGHEARVAAAAAVEGTDKFDEPAAAVEVLG
jgi:hypothetical protein